MGPDGAVDSLQAALEALVRRALDVGDFPVGWISVLEADGERLLARAGVGFAELPAERSLALGTTFAGPCFIEDAAQGEWRAHPLVTGAPRARFVGIVPLLGSTGALLGTLTVLDPSTRAIRPNERTALANLGSLAAARLEAARAGGAPANAPGDRVRRLEERLAQERAFSDALLDNVDASFCLVADDGTLLRWNRQMAETLGYSDERIAAMTPLDFVSAPDKERVREALRTVLEEGRAASIEAEIVDAEGNVRPFALDGRPVVIGGRRTMIGMGRDITLRRRTEEQMVRAKERLDLALASSNLALWDWDLSRNRVYFNESWSALMGEAARESTFTAEEVLQWAHADDRQVFRAALGNTARGVSEEFDCEYRVRDTAGEWKWIHSRGKVTQRDEGGRALRMTGTSTDVSKRKRAEERAEYLATRDALTGLPNRVLLHDRLEQAVVNAARHQAGFAFMFIDLDRFKTINDSLGHHAGDELLKGVAGRLTACVRASDTVARLGGDEFAVILENLRDDDDEGAQQVAEKMIAAMAAPLPVEGQALTTSCSIGIGLYPADGRDSATLMKNADVAMYYAKEKGRNNYQFFSSEMNARAQERLSVENYLRLALRRNELVLHYQPRMTLGGELVGVEALVRWQHPRRGLLTPDKFIAVAEDSGLITRIGEWVLRTACVQVQLWQARVQHGLRISVNLSVDQLGDGERLVRAVAESLHVACLDASCLELEITESHLMKDVEEKAAILQRLGELGVGIAIDDFGTGYSSLSYLKRLPVDAVKIDSSFVRDIETDPNDEAIVRAILAMAHSLKLSVVAEGVETAAQFELLRALGCDQYQGFHESPALPAAEFERRYGR
jgi:diguanylate cyclase (GGDEF)-like protein/PAS domain S-box-containing protein